MNEEILKNLSREEAINYLNNEMDYTYQLRQRIDKAIKYMNNTFNISSVKDMFDIMNTLEEILKGDVDE